MAGRVESRLRIGAYVAVAFGVATIGLELPKGALGFALSPAGLACAAVAAGIAGDPIEERGTLRWIRAGVATRLAGAAIALLAVAWGLATRGGQELFPFGLLMIGPGLLGLAVFALKDARVLADVRFGQALALRRIGNFELEIEADRGAIRFSLDALLDIKLATTTTGRGLVFVLDPKAKIDGPAEKLPWFEERVHARAFYLDEHQLGDDAMATAKRIAEAMRMERGGYR